MPDISYILSINDVPASPDQLRAIQQIEVEDNADLADMMRLRVYTGQAESGQTWNVIDDGVFDRLTKIQLRIAFGFRVETLMTAYVTEIQADLSNQPGRSILNITAMDPTILMELSERVREWPDMSDSDIAQTIFGNYGFLPDVEATRYTRRAEDETTMQRASDIRFLQDLAERNGYEVFVETNPLTGLPEGHFHRPRLESPQGVLSINLGHETNVNSLRFRNDTTRPATANASSIDVRSTENQPVSVEESRLTGLGAARTIPSTQRRQLLPTGNGRARTAELQAAAQSLVDRSSFSITGDGDLNTVAYGAILRAKRPVLVRGAGRQFNGTYYVDRVTHSITGDGYRQSFSLRRNATELDGRESFVLTGALP